MERDRRSPIWVILAAFLLVAALVVGPVVDSSAKKRNRKPGYAAGSSWQLVFEDDFNGQKLDDQKWTSAFPWGRDRSNVGELQYYAPDAFTLSSGKLNIITKPTPNGSHAYDSGLISSYESFAPEFGRFEIRCKLPSGKGLWPAFWLLPEDTSWPPEIDVFEALGHEPNKVHMTAHWLQNGEHQQDGVEYSGPNFSQDFHTFAVEWTADRLVWFIDGVKRHEVTGQSPRGPMYLLANLAVGGEWPGAPNASTPFPARFDIDYIRAYASSPAPSARDGTAKDTHKHGRKKKHQRKRHRLATGDDGFDAFQ